MKKLITTFILLSGCATVPTRLDIRDYCGEVGPLSVYANRDNGFVDCAKAKQVTQDAYALLQQTVGPLKETWDVEYTYKYLHFIFYDFQTGSPTTSVGITSTLTHSIRVREQYSHSIFHELLHAYIHENSLAVNVQAHHKLMCSTHAWWRAEANFSHWPYYCAEVGGVK